MEYFHKDCITFLDCFGWYCHINNIKSSNSFTWDIFLIIYIFNFFQWYFIIFLCTSLVLLLINLFCSILFILFVYSYIFFKESQTFFVFFVMSLRYLNNLWETDSSFYAFVVYSFTSGLSIQESIYLLKSAFIEYLEYT